MKKKKRKSKKRIGEAHFSVDCQPTKIETEEQLDTKTIGIYNLRWELGLWVSWFRDGQLHLLKLSRATETMLRWVPEDRQEAFLDHIVWAEMWGEVRMLDAARLYVEVMEAVWVPA